MDILQLSDQIRNLDKMIWTAIIAATASLIVALLNFYSQSKSLKIQKAQISLIQKGNKRNILQRQLDEFYVPFDQYLSKTTQFYKNFRQDLPREFRALIYLIDKETLFQDSKGKMQKVILSEEKLKMLDKIILLEEKLDTLIIEKAALISDETLIKNYNPDKSMTDIKLFIDKEEPASIPKEIGLLTLFSVHLEYLKMAQNGEIDKSDIVNIEKYVFPREINTKIKENIKTIKKEILELG